MATLDELTTPATRKEVEAAIYATLAARGVKTTGWKSGAVVRTMIVGISIVLAALSRLQAAIARGGFLELATGDWLTLVARYVYDVERSPGAFATAVVTVDNTGGGVFAGDPDDLVFSSSTTGKLYRNTEAFAIGSGETGVEIPVQAVELGTDSNASADEIDTLETTLLNVVIDSSTTALGQDEETDAQLRQRCREKTGTLSPNGPRDAYAFLARSAVREDGTAIGVTRVLTIADGNGNVDVYVATAGGVLDGDATDPATDLGAVADAIHRLCEPLAVTPRVQNATPVEQGLTVEIWIRDTAGLTESDVEELVEEAFEAHCAEQPIGGVVLPGEPGRLYVDAIEAAIARELPAGVFLEIDVTTPAGDVDLEIPEFVVAGNVIATVHLVPGGHA